MAILRFKGVGLSSLDTQDYNTERSTTQRGPEYADQAVTGRSEQSKAKPVRLQPTPNMAMKRGLYAQSAAPS